MAVKIRAAKEGPMTLEARKLVASVGIVKGLNIRLERNYKTEQFAKEINAAGEIYEQIRIRKPVPGEDVDVSKAPWVVAGDGHRRVMALRHMAEHMPDALVALKPVRCLVVKDARNEVELMLRTGGGEGTAAKTQLEPIEQAIGYQRLRDNGVSPEEIAELVNMRGPHVRQRLKLLNAPQEVRDAIHIIGTNQAENIAFRHESTGREFQIFLTSLAVRAKAVEDGPDEDEKRILVLLVGDAISRHGKERKDIAVGEIKKMMANGSDYPSPQWIAKQSGRTGRAGRRPAAWVEQDGTSGPQSKDNLREIWPNEARDFTPWLAGHLSELGKALRLELKLEERESSVGGYALDILARDLGSGSLVVIENQLEPTNHDHLGKLLTYAAAYDAKVMVWIAKKFNSTHRDALDFLNRCTGKDRQFFGVKVDLREIKDSRPTVEFTLVATPKEWREQTRRAGKPENQGRTRTGRTRTAKRP